MESSRQNNLLYDEIRKIWVAASPEEIVRQTLIQRMTQSLGFPRELIAVEKALSELPHLSKDVPDRRADIIVFAKEIHPQYSLFPLLLIECKQEKEKKGALDQLMGYNHFVKAAFIAVASAEEILFGYSEKDSYRFISFIPAYSELVKAIKK